jgi:hypothetical protein
MKKMDICVHLHDLLVIPGTKLQSKDPDNPATVIGYTLVTSLTFGTVMIAGGTL